MSKSKILAYITLGATLSASILMGIAAALFPEGNINLYICFASIGIFLMTLRFNVYAIRNEKTEQLVAENHFCIAVSLYMLLRFIDLCVGGMHVVLYFCLLGVLALYLIFAIVLYVRRKVRRNSYR